MQPRSQRRVYGAEFKAQVLAECQQPGASVAAIALAHGLNVNLLRKWLVGRGLKRTGLVAPRTVMRRLEQERFAAPPAASLQFLPVERAAGPLVADDSCGASCAPMAEVAIHVELRRGSTQLAVRWPAAHAGACSAWLQELAAAALK